MLWATFLRRKFRYIYAMRPKGTKFSEITQIRAISPFKVIQGHRFWYQSKAHIRLPVSD